MAKSQTIEDYIKEHGETFYTKKSFVHVVNTGLDTNRLEEDASFLEIKKCIYNIIMVFNFQKTLFGMRVLPMFIIDYFIKNENQIKRNVGETSNASPTC